MLQYHGPHTQVILADDLTGATDTGVHFARAGLRTRVCLDALPEDAPQTSDVLVIDTDSRPCDAATAYARVYRAAKASVARGLPLLYKKLDSTLRGALGAELDAVIDAGRLQLVILAPAFPANQRTLRHGVLYVGETPVAQTAFAHDPQTPVTESHLPTLLAAQTVRPIHALDLAALAIDTTRLAQRLHTLYHAAGAIVVCDAATDAHLTQIAEAARLLGAGSLLAGSAGLAHPLAAHVAQHRVTAQVGHLLVVIGSLHPILHAQLDELVRQYAATVIALDLATAAGDAAQWSQWREDALRHIANAPPAAPIVLTTPPVLASHTQRPHLLPRLAELAAAIARQLPLRGAVATGGSTAHALLAAWGATGIDLVDEIAPGVVLGAVSGGLCAGLPLVTKAGGFGTTATLATAVAQLQMRAPEGAWIRTAPDGAGRSGGSLP